MLKDPLFTVLNQAAFAPCILSRLEGGSGLRADVVFGRGTIPDLLAVGEPFLMEATPEDEDKRYGYGRQIATSMVVKIVREAGGDGEVESFLLTTMSGSLYRVVYTEVAGLA